VTTPPVVVGADVGGTSTRVGVATLAGEMVSLATGGPGNPNSLGLAGSAAVIRSVTERALDSVDGQVAAVVIALAGGSRAVADPGFLAAAAPRGVGPEPVLVSDLTAAFYSATPETRGAVLLAGTGSVAGQILGNQLVQQRDGWGWLLGDEGSGFWIGRASVRATLAGLQRRAPPGPLARDVLVQSGATDYVSLLQACYRQPPTWLAQFAPLVSRHARDDAVAAAIADEAAETLWELLLSLPPRPGEPVVLAGSVLTANGPVSRALRQRLTGAPRVATTTAGHGPGATGHGIGATSVLSAASGVVGALWLALAAPGRSDGERSGSRAGLHAALLGSAQRWS
jgi:N-acetylglucosamine kinase-like BadF-type ATPase